MAAAARAAGIWAAAEIRAPAGVRSAERSASDTTTGRNGMMIAAEEAVGLLPEGVRTLLSLFFRAMTVICLIWCWKFMPVTGLLNEVLGLKNRWRRFLGLGKGRRR